MNAVANAVTAPRRTIGLTKSLPPAPPSCATARRRFAERRADLKKLKACPARPSRRDRARVGRRFRPPLLAQETAMIEVMTPVQGIDYLHRSLRRFMRPQRCHVAMTFPLRQRARRIPAARRDRHRRALELSRRARPDAAGDRDGRRQPGDDQAFRIHAGDERLLVPHAGRDFPRGAGRRHHR